MFVDAIFSKFVSCFFQRCFFLDFQTIENPVWFKKNAWGEIISMTCIPQCNQRHQKKTKVIFYSLRRGPERLYIYIYNPKNQPGSQVTGGLEIQKTPVVQRQPPFFGGSNDFLGSRVFLGL